MILSRSPRSVTQTHYYQSLDDMLLCVTEKLRVVCEQEFPGRPIGLLGIDISQIHQECASDETNIQLDFLTGLSKGDKYRDSPNHLPAKPLTYKERER